MDNIIMNSKKNENKEYLKQKQKFFDLVDNVEDEKLKRRVERNLAKMNIPSTTSPEAFYIIECEENYSTKQDAENNSRNRILNMEERLKKVKSGNWK